MQSQHINTASTPFAVLVNQSNQLADDTAAVDALPQAPHSAENEREKLLEVIDACGDCV